MLNFQGVTQHPLLQLSGISAFFSKSIESDKQFSNRRTSSCNAYVNYKWYINKPFLRGDTSRALGHQCLGVNIKYQACSKHKHWHLVDKVPLETLCDVQIQCRHLRWRYRSLKVTWPTRKMHSRREKNTSSSCTILQYREGMEGFFLSIYIVFIREGLCTYNIPLPVFTGGVT